MLLCDIVMVAEDARIGDTHVSRVGLVAGDGGTVIWPLLVGINKAKEFLTFLIRHIPYPCSTLFMTSSRKMLAQL